MKDGAIKLTKKLVKEIMEMERPTYQDVIWVGRWLVNHFVEDRTDFSIKTMRWYYDHKDK